MSFQNSITLVKVKDGESSESYEIRTNTEEILRFNTSDGFSFSPSEVIYSVYKNNEQQKNFNWSFSFLYGYNYIKLEQDDLEFLKGCIGTERKQQGESEAQINTSVIDYTNVYFYPKDLYEFFFKTRPEVDLTNYDRLQNLKASLENSSLTFKFSVLEEEEPILSKYMILRNGVSSEMAKLDLNAADIVASIQKASLRFSATGLELKNGDFIIYDEKGRSVLYTENDNLILRGTVYADNGTFEGTVYANDGTFSGAIYAASGAIGGFTMAGYREGEIGVKNYDSYKDPVYIKIDNSYYQLLKESGESEGTEAKYYYEDGNKERKELGVASELDALQLYLVDGRLISAEGGIVLDGMQNKIIAETIELGKGAVITDFIQLGDAFLRNPTKNEDRYILQSDKISLTDDGYMKLGTIEMYGGSESEPQMAYIRSTRKDANGQINIGEWEINEDGTARFDKIWLNEAHIQDSILEIGTVQSIGSLMLFKDSWAVKNSGTEPKSESEGENGSESEIESKRYYIILESPSENSSINLEEDDYVYDGNCYYKVEEIVQIEEIENKKIIYLNKVYLAQITTSSTGQFNPGNSVTKFGKSDGSDYVMSILGENPVQNPWDFSTGNSLTISSFKPSETKKGLEFTKHLILGKLSNSGIGDLEDVKGFGLYADNVYLNGSLTTKISNKGYAGINTLSNAKFNKNATNLSPDTSSIVFWGGASGTDIESIQAAPFQVSANGTLYTSQAIIENSIVAGANIYGSKIYTAEIHGWNNEEGKRAALTIYDSVTGISFKTAPDDENPSGVETFTIGESGFKVNDSYFISIKDQQVSFLAGNNKLNANGLSFSDDFKIQKEDASLNFKFNKEGEDNTAVRIDKEKVSHNITTELKAGLWLVGKKASIKMQYKETDNGDGYDLYIY